MKTLNLKSLRGLAFWTGYVREAVTSSVTSSVTSRDYIVEVQFSSGVWARSNNPGTKKTFANYATAAAAAKKESARQGLDYRAVPLENPYLPSTKKTFGRYLSNLYIVEFKGAYLGWQRSRNPKSCGIFLSWESAQAAAKEESKHPIGMLEYRATPYHPEKWYVIEYEREDRTWKRSGNTDTEGTYTLQEAQSRAHKEAKDTGKLYRVVLLNSLEGA